MRIYVALLLSGLAALVHELMWVRLLGDLFGHTIFAVQTVLTVFFGGIALGAWAVSRIRIARPLLVFACIELGIAAWGALIPLFVRAATVFYDARAPLDTETPAALGIRLAVTFMLLIVPATLMGATFPIMAAATGRIATVYAVNTAGGAAGVWLTAFVVLPAIGVSATIGAAAAMNVVAALLVSFRRSAADAERPEVAGDALPSAPLLLFATGMVALALELLWTRALEQILSGTIYTFATVLAVYLAGIAFGGVITSRIRASRSRLAIVLAALGATVVATPSIVPLLERLHRSGLARGPAAESLVAMALLLVPTTLMGMTFPMLLTLGRQSIARLTAANTAGSLLGPLVGGFLLLPRLGLALTIVILGIVTAAFSLAVAPRRGFAAAFVAALTLVAIPMARPLRIYDAGESLIAYRDHTAATVAVVRGAEGQRLKVNNSYSLGGGRGVFTERRQGHLPMFLHSDPSRVLVLGIGTGNTLGAVSMHRPERLVAVDLLPGVVDLASTHFAATNENVLRRPDDAQVLVADAARIVRSSHESFDIVIGDLFHPWQAGVSGLYSEEHFASVRARLGDRGVFVQWLPLYQLSTDDFRTVTRTFLRVFPHSEAWLGNFGATTPIVALVGSNAPIAFQAERWEAALRDTHLRSRLTAVYLDQRVELDASYVCDRSLLETFAGPGPVNTKDRPRIEFSAAASFFRDHAEREKRASLMELVKMAAAQDRSDRARGKSDPLWFENRLGIRAFIVTFVALEERNWREAARGAVMAAEKCTTYDMPRRTLAAIGFELLAADRTLAADVFRAALRFDPKDERARAGLAAAQK